ncbi:(d)CMP kinase [Lawsonibacter sp. LCP25S3_G6]|uniref:(d)CMP kinase n=1 Tax=unclassified Lawsonibacter TaxID=2617946 RepID=UPI003F97E0E7
MERGIVELKSIAIDGPAGAGKSTLARQLAKELGFLYVDTGAIYRTVALAVLRAGIAAEDSETVSSLLESLNIRMDYGPDGEQRMFLAGEDVSKAIREHQVSGLASKVSAIPAVRDFLLDFQRRQAREHSVVMDGRDIGTVVLPQADVKIFLTAAPEARARRRLLELQQRGQQADLETVLRDIVQRDDQDEHRAIAPLRRAEDAELLDTTQLNLEQSLQELLRMVKEKIDL